MNVEIGDLFANFLNILNKWKISFSQVWIFHIANDVRQVEIHTAKLLILKPFEFEIAFSK
jgi:hypothetical protein